MDRLAQTARRARPVLAAGVLGLLLACGAHGAAAQETEDGFIVGPWLIAPWIGADYSQDTNVFRNVEGEEEDDSVTEFAGGLSAELPFRNSLLSLDYEISDLDYGKNVFERTLAQELGVQLELNFRTGDTLTLSETYTQDFSRIEEQVEDVFTGQPYNINRWQVVLERDLPQEQGYLMRVRRKDLIYDEVVGSGSVFEYRGFDNLFEYRQPLGERRKGLLRYRSRRFNHYDPTEPDEVGRAFRKEETDAILIGLSGQLGEQQPYQVRLGYSRFRFKGVASEDFDGIVGALNWRIRVGGRTDLRLEASREPLPSNFNTFYINNALRTVLAREWRRFEGGAETRINRYTYGDENLTATCTGTRRDMAYETGLFWEWKVHQRFSFDLSAYYYNRSSNCEGFEYRATSIESGFTLGWF